ncbi:hypothetical protein BX616_002762 [Lobosporangium transversale]|uniref:Uncharacterized protein n=1 Tax=Lobosporangium transversale TaxID=64571 RepID=A0A1Y2GCD2_9FUNG|nr:hypothetical protein BCR41DRAFT_373767 [Lobosporangium transversale]KAF9916802.1 hypothetical protein BX616_002762 [Lobosporangium transversale]ORZ06978.1 hypothetical protein BCR41DRAFT_373767 [Lobosporangium transversale]|eukprot:XP_021877774.1 hypothetical protein BCR41DRAFT_373767 [Lobosporangium transversale]
MSTSNIEDVRKGIESTNKSIAKCNSDIEYHTALLARAKLNNCDIIERNKLKFERANINLGAGKHDSDGDYELVDRLVSMVEEVIEVNKTAIARYKQQLEGLEKILKELQ